MEELGPEPCLLDNFVPEEPIVIPGVVLPFRDLRQLMQNMYFASVIQKICSLHLGISAQSEIGGVHNL